MAYLNLDAGYFTHIKTQRLVGKLGSGAELIPLLLWCHAATHYPMDGILPNYNPEEIKSVCKWSGNATIMLLALLELKVLDDLGSNNYKVHAWEEHQGHIISFKMRAKSNADKRWAIYRNNKKIAISNATSIADSNAPTYYTNHTNYSSSIFKPPLIDEVTEYCQERKNNVIPQDFIDFYESKGWLVGKNKMKNWKAALRRSEKWECWNKKQINLSKLPEAL